MKMHLIEIDDEVLSFLKKNAEPLEDTHNSVLRKLLFGNSIRQIGSGAEEEMPKIPDGVPKALSQILEVIYFVKKRGFARTEATNKVAMLRNTAPQTVIDKYCRQLDKKAYEIDQLLQDHNLHEFRSLLEHKFNNHTGVINEFFKLYKGGAI